MAGTNISRANGSGSATNKFTLSVWVKRGFTDQGRMFSATGGSGDVYFRFNSGGYIEWSGHGSNASSAGYFITNRRFRDYAAWYHFVIRFDSTQGSASDRLRFYVNGVQEESFSTYTDVNQDATDNISLSSNTHYWGGTVSSQYFDGMMTHMHYSNGYSYGPDTFGETDATTGAWEPKSEPSLTYGSQGYFLKFQNAGAMGTDSSGNGNTFTVANGTLTQIIDSPSHNFATLNALCRTSGGAFSQGQNTFTDSSGSYQSSFSTIGMFNGQGKYYAEFKVASGSSVIFGIADKKLAGVIDRIEDGETRYIGEYANSYGYQMSGTFYYNGSSTSTGYDSYTSSDVIGMAVDMENLKIYWHKNGVYQNSKDPASDNGETIVAPDECYHMGISVASSAANVNFGNGVFGTTAISDAGTNTSGNGSFEYDVPTGYTALSSKGINL